MQTFNYEFGNRNLVRLFYLHQKHQAQRFGFAIKLSMFVMVQKHNLSNPRF